SPGQVLTEATGLGAPRGGCEVPPSAWCQDWVTALRCGALERCLHLTQRHLDVDICAVCQQLFDFLHQASNQSAIEVPVVGILCLCPPGMVTLCQAVVQVLVGHLLWQIQHLINGTAPQKPWQVCATLKLCHGEPGATPAVPVLEAPGTHLQGSGRVGLSQEALPLPLCWLCRTLVARAE
ncbi:PSPB protein, partial [Nicator chloris]|nr:PSPB protein [Nicator chloris]